MFKNPTEGNGYIRYKISAVIQVLLRYIILRIIKVCGTVSPADVLVYQETDLLCMSILQRKFIRFQKESTVNIELENDEECRLFVIIPKVPNYIYRIDGKIYFSKTYERLNDNSFLLKEEGRFAFVSDATVVKVLSDGKKCNFERHGNLYEADTLGTKNRNNYRKIEYKKV